MSEVLISIVNYRSYEKTADAVKSFYEKAVGDYSKKIVIVDNSEDRAEAKKLEALKERFKGLALLVPDRNIGFGAGHNLAFDEFAEDDTKFFVIVNPDTVLENDATGIMRDFLNKYKNCAMTVPRLLTPDGQIQKAYRRELTRRDMFLRRFLPHAFKKRDAYHTMQDMDYSRPFRVPFAQGSFLMIRAEVFRDLKGFDEKYFLYLEDADLCMRVNKTSYICYVPTAKVTHLWEKGSGKDLKLFMIHVKSMNRYFRKWT
ncbi:MAG: glycosyltransferase family 2 protein [Lachnospiraceae bacterium]|nr:glycosyltransferase family 2 protein [Lachnospiraceae bacterium]